MFQGLVSRQERNQLLDELYKDLDSPYFSSIDDRLDGFTFEIVRKEANSRIDGLLPVPVHERDAVHPNLVAHSLCQVQLSPRRP